MYNCDICAIEINENRLCNFCFDYLLVLKLKDNSLIHCNYEIYSNDLWKAIDPNICNWDFSGEFIQKHIFKNFIIKYDKRVKGVKVI